jgi:hypothetical protein
MSECILSLLCFAVVCALFASLMTLIAAIVTLIEIRKNR